jgi:hypothetical protein
MDIRSNTGTGGKAGLRKISFKHFKMLVWENFIKDALNDQAEWDDIPEPYTTEEEYIQDAKKGYVRSVTDLDTLENYIENYSIVTDDVSTYKEILANILDF